MSKIWKIINYNKRYKIKNCLKEINKGNYVASEWIIDLFKNYKTKLSKKDYPIQLCRIKVKHLKITKPTELKKIYSKINKLGYNLVSPEIALITRLIYKEQKKGEWLRFATPFKSLIDSDGVPHLPKLGKALNKFFIETYWSYPKAIFHPHNEFVVIKKNVKKIKNK